MIGDGGYTQEKVYTAGPMTGYPDLNYPAFMSLEKYLLTFPGISVVNPAALDQVPNAEHYAIDGSELHLYLRRDFRELAWCTGIVMMPGWMKSIGANCELAMARMLALDIYQAVIGLDGEWVVAELRDLKPRYDLIRAYSTKLYLLEGATG